MAAAGPVFTGPNLMAWYDSALRSVDGIGLTPHEMVAVVESVDGYVRGQARTAADAADSGMVAAQDAELQRYVRMDRFPTLARLAEAGGPGAAAAGSEFGLRWMIDGVEAMVRARNQG